MEESACDVSTSLSFVGADLTVGGWQGADYQRMANLYGDVWEASNFGEAPLSIRVTDNYGVSLSAP